MTVQSVERPEGRRWLGSFIWVDRSVWSRWFRCDHWLYTRIRKERKQGGRQWKAYYRDGIPLLPLNSVEYITVHDQPRACAWQGQACAASPRRYQPTAHRAATTGSSQMLAAPILMVTPKLFSCSPGPHEHAQYVDYPSQWLGMFSRPRVGCALNARAINLLYRAYIQARLCTL